MEFCPECGTVMFPQDECFNCKKCGYKRKITKELIVNIRFLKR